VIDGELVVPSSATYTLRGNDGGVINALSDVAITLADNATYAVVNVDASANTASVPSAVRYLETTITVDGADYTITEFYQIRANTRFPLNAQDVRDVLGVGDNEVSDNQIDILAAYEMVKGDLPEVNLDNILTNGTTLLPYLIAAVKYKAALFSGMTMQNSMFQMEQADNTLYRRFEEIDFDSLRNSIGKLYSEALRMLGGGEASPNYTFQIMAVGVDNVTGQ
jgi:hypothetical protein